MECSIAYALERVGCPATALKTEQRDCIKYLYDTFIEEVSLVLLRSHKDEYVAYIETSRYKHCVIEYKLGSLCMYVCMHVCMYVCMYVYHILRVIFDGFLDDT